IGNPQDTAAVRQGEGEGVHHVVVPGGRKGEELRHKLFIERHRLEEYNLLPLKKGRDPVSPFDLDSFDSAALNMVKTDLIHPLDEARAEAILFHGGNVGFIVGVEFAVKSHNARKIELIRCAAMRYQTSSKYPQTKKAE